MRSSLVFYQAKQNKIKKIEEIALLSVFSPYFGILFQNEICTKKVLILTWSNSFQIYFLIDKQLVDILHVQ